MEVMLQLKGPFLVVFLSAALWIENFTFYISLSSSFYGYPLLKNHDFISQKCLTKSFSAEHIRQVLMIDYIQ